MVLVKNITFYYKYRKVIFILDDMRLRFRNTSRLWYGQPSFCPGVDGPLSLGHSPHR